MNSLDKKHIEIFREYFLSHNEDVRRNIKNILPGILLKYLSIIETGFLQKTAVENIASQIEANHLIPELKQLQTDYYSSLDRIFEKELAFAIRVTERESLKKKFEAIDLEEGFQLQESEIKSAVTQVERESIKQKLVGVDRSGRKLIKLNIAIKYAAAAIIIGLIFTTGYLMISNKKNTDKNLYSINKSKENKQPTDIIKLPDLLEHQVQMKILVPASFGFANLHKSSITVVIRNIGEQIDTLKKIYASEIEGKNKSGNGPVAKKIAWQVDSLTAIGNTYSYAAGNKTIVLWLLKQDSVKSISSFDPNQNKEIYIKIDKSYYQIKETVTPVKLIRVQDKSIIEGLNKIEFQNQ